MKTLSKIEELVLKNKYNDESQIMLDIANSATNPRLIVAMMLQITSREQINYAFSNPAFTQMLFNLVSTFDKPGVKDSIIQDVTITEVDIIHNKIRYVTSYSAVKVKFVKLEDTSKFTLDPTDITEEEFKALKVEEINSYYINDDRKDYITYKVSYDKLQEKSQMNINDIYKRYDSLIRKEPHLPVCKEMLELKEYFNLD